MDEPFDDDVYVYAYDDDEEVALQFRLNLAVTDDNWGLEFGLAYDVAPWALDMEELEIDEGGEGALYVYNAHGWFTIADIVTLRAGLIDPGVWTVDGWIDENLSSGLGLRIEATPMEGVNVGAMFSFPDPYKNVEDGAEKVFGTTAGFFQEVAFGFSYEQEDLFEVSAAIKLNSNEWWDDTEYEFDQEMNVQFIAGFGFYGVENLSIYAGLSVTTDADPDGEWDEDGETLTLIGINAGYDVTPELWAGLEIGFTLWDGLKRIDFYPEVSYQVSEEISVGAGVPFAMAEDEADDMGLEKVGLDLWAKYTVGNAFAQIGYGFENFMEDYGDRLDHYIQLTFGFSF